MATHKPAEIPAIVVYGIIDVKNALPAAVTLPQ